LENVVVVLGVEVVVETPVVVVEAGSVVVVVDVVEVVPTAAVIGLELRARPRATALTPRIVTPARHIVDACERFTLSKLLPVFALPRSKERWSPPDRLRGLFGVTRS
jgi:hypothetical protein